MTKTTAKRAKAFSLRAKCARSGALTYSSKNKRVKVSKKGKVTIPKNFVGKTVITIKAAASKNYKAASGVRQGYRKVEEERESNWI